MVVKNQRLNWVIIFLLVLFLFLPTCINTKASPQRVVYSHIISPQPDIYIYGVNHNIVGVATQGTKYVEVSTDGGGTWHKARPLRETYAAGWIYYWTWFYSGTYTIMSRAVEEDGFVQANPEAITVHIELPKILTMVQGVIVNDYEIKPVPEERLDEFFYYISKHFDIVELKIWSGWWRDNTIRMAQKVIDRAHHWGMRVALSCWAYPNDNEKSPWWYHAQVLDEKTGRPKDVITYIPYDKPALDRGNPDAVRFMIDKWQQNLERLRDIDYIFFDEDKLQDWSESWPKLTTNYWDSPTYSLADLISFRKFLIERYGEQYRLAKFPVNHKKFINPRTELNLDPGYWAKWQAWRKELFAKWINLMAKRAYDANRENPNFHGNIYMQWQRVVDGDNYGVDLMTIGKEAKKEEPSLFATFVCEHGEDIESWRNELGARFVSRIAHHGLSINYGGFVNFYRWFAGEYNAEETIREEFELAIKYDAQIIVTFPGMVFYPRSKYYDKNLVELWHELVKKYIK